MHLILICNNDFLERLKESKLVRYAIKTIVNYCLEFKLCYLKKTEVFHKSQKLFEWWLAEAKQNELSLTINKRNYYAINLNTFKSNLFLI